MYEVTCLDSYGNAVDYFTQWDIDQEISVTIFDYADYYSEIAPEVHFTNRKMDTALRVMGNENVWVEGDVLTAKVPNQLLQEPYPIFVYVYLTGIGENNSSQQTVLQTEIVVRKRNKPDEYQYAENITSYTIEQAKDDITAELTPLIEANAQAIKDETERATGAEATLQTNIDAEAEARQKEDSAIYTRIAGEKSELQTNIDNEVARATAAEKVNADAIAGVKEDVDTFFASAEIGEAAIDTLKELQEYIDTHGEAAATMTANIAENKAAIEAEKSRAEAAESSLGSRVKTMEDDYLTESDKTELQNAINGKASQTDLNSLGTRMSTAESNISTLQSNVSTLQTNVSNAQSTADEALGTAQGAVIDMEELVERVNQISETQTSATLNSLGITATAQELNYMDGVTSSVQGQLDNKASSSHTHNYAGSSSVGGAATSANKLNTNAGDVNTPVYFNNGVPVACTSLDLNTSGNAATATTATTISSTLPITKGGTGATTSIKALNNLGITWGTAEAPATSTPNTIYIQIN